MMNAESNMRVEFDPLNRKQVEEVKGLFRQYKEGGRRLMTLSGAPVETFRECLEEGGYCVTDMPRPDHFYFRIYDKTGDTRVAWNSNDPDQIAEAKRLFEEYLGKGWRAYTVSRTDPDKRGARVRGFSEDLEEIIFDDVPLEKQLGSLAKAFTDRVKVEEEKRVTSRAKVKDFFKIFREDVQMLPKTMPG